ncbi:hypothetical protein HNP73_003009 [Amaricoccus macauensis]|uniref:Uncharacterized protein n=1 Tax=Amaricoccus macauensis TaxID=57001 RepID=A0A840SV94_9RHOB|nr:hypothetical protein [Amaricoccus macauensis]
MSAGPAARFVCHDATGTSVLRAVVLIASIAKD